MKFSKYIIHLPRAVARRENAIQLRERLGAGALIMEAVDWKDLSVDQFELQRINRYRPHYPFGLKPAETATFLSHRACWQRLLDDGSDLALILEDDVALGPEFDEALSFSVGNVGGGRFIRLPQRKKETGTLVAIGEGGLSLLRPKVIGLGMIAQIVTREAATKLLAASSNFDRPVDTFLQMKWVHQVDVLSVWPSGVSEISAELGGTLIHQNKSFGAKVWREIRRPLYRATVKWRSGLSLDAHGETS